jgi:hypothetical protein
MEAIPERQFTDRALIAGRHISLGRRQLRDWPHKASIHRSAAQRSNSQLGRAESEVSDRPSKAARHISGTQRVNAPRRRNMRLTDGPPKAVRHISSTQRVNSQKLFSYFATILYQQSLVGHPAKLRRLVMKGEIIDKQDIGTKWIADCEPAWNRIDGDAY